MSQKPTWMLNCLAWLLILIAVFDMFILLDFMEFMRLYRYLPRDLIMFRYGFSWIIAWVELVMAVGLLTRKEFFRKAVIVLWFLLLCTAHLKFPFAAWQGYVIHLQKTGLLNPKFYQMYQLNTEKITLLIVSSLRLKEIILAVIVVYFLSRSKVRSQFS